MNYNIPSFKAYVKRSHLTKQPSDELDPCYVFGIQSLAGKVLTFHIMTDYGALRSRAPIDAIVLKKGTDYPVDFLQLWDCFSENVCVVCFDYLCGKRCQVLLKDKTWVWAEYLMTIDWFNNPYSDEPTDYKCGHLLIGDGGQLFLQPNNRLKWYDMNFVTRDFPISPKEFKVDTELISVESFSDRWVSEDTDSYYYDVNEKNEKQKKVKPATNSETKKVRQFEFIGNEFMSMLDYNLLSQMKRGTVKDEWFFSTLHHDGIEWAEKQGWFERDWKEIEEKLADNDGDGEV